MVRLDQHWILKGGYAIQLRTGRASTTQDVDLLVMDKSVQDIENIFREELEKDMGDFLSLSFPNLAPLALASIVCGSKCSLALLEEFLKDSM